MPNYVTTYININSEDNKALTKLYNNIDKWTSKDYAENGFGHNWLGNIVLGAKIGTVDKNNNPDNLRVRGSLNSLDLSDKSIVIQTETAYIPMLKMWKRLIDKYIPDAELIYTVMVGNELFTNDPANKDLYEIDPFQFEDLLH